MKNRALLVLACLLCSILALCGCGGQRECEAYAAFCHSYNGQADFEIDGVCYTGSFTVSPAGTDGMRRASLTYRAPAALSGVTLLREGEALSLSLGTLSHALTGEGAAHMGAVFDLFTPVPLLPAGQNVWRYTDGEETREVCTDGEGRLVRLCLRRGQTVITLYPEAAA